MDSRRLTNGLLFIVAVALVAHLGLRFTERPLMAETFKLDACVTERPSEKPASYLHVVMHGMADVDAPQALRR
jgi:hypothetical protein